MAEKEDIAKFVQEMGAKYGYLPKFCHNLNPDLKNKVYYSGAYFDDNELVAAINALLFGKWSSSGEICAQFEREFSEKINQKYSFFTNSGSSANLLLIAACKEYYGWEKGNRVLVSAVGFPTTVSAIVQNELSPYFVDIEWETLNFNLDKIEEILDYHIGFLKSDNIKAVFLSPVLGNPPNIDKLTALCSKYDIKLLLDNCDSLGSKWKDKYLNEYAVASSCSFYPAHEISTLEGGMVSSDIEGIVKLVRSYATWGRRCECIGKANLLANGSCGKRFSCWIDDFPDLVIDDKYVFNRIGYNLKPLDLQAAIGLEQLKKLDFIYNARTKNQRQIEDLFGYVNYVRVPKILAETRWVPFGVPIICQSKDAKQKLVKYLEDNGIQTRNYFAGNLLMHKGYKHLGDYKKYPEANKVLDLVFFVGCAPTISQENIKYIEHVLSQYPN